MRGMMIKATSHQSNAAACQQRAAVRGAAAAAAAAARSVMRIAGGGGARRQQHLEQQQQQQQQQSQQQSQQQQSQQQQHQQQQWHHSGRRAAVLAGLALVGFAAAPQRAARAADAAPTQQGAALEEYMNLEAKGKLKDRRALDDFRARFGIRRLLDGRVQLRARGGEWYTVRLDMEVPGALLLRDPKGGVYAIETEGLPQVDLSDDYVLLMLFADGSWQDQMQGIEYEDADNPGSVVQLTMGEREFREFVGILAGLEEDDGGKSKKKKGGGK